MPCRVTRITPCTAPPIKRINTMNPDPNGDFTVEAGSNVIVTTITNGIRIDAAGGGGGSDYSNTDGNLDIDNVNHTIDLESDVSIANDLNVGNDVLISGDLQIAGDIFQSGATYETHAEKVYTTKDYIYMRDGAVTGLNNGDYSGFEVELYDGVNNGRLVIDNTGTARVGDVGAEQPLLTREETGYMTDGKPLIWNGNNVRAETANVTLGKILSGTASVSTSDWTTATRLDGTQYSFKDITIAGVTTNGLPIIRFNSYMATAFRQVLTASNTITIYVEGSAPTSAFTIDYFVIEPM